MKKKNNQRGFTLVETVVTFIILALLISITASLILSSMNSLTFATDANEARHLCYSIYDFYERQLKYAEQIKTGSVKPDGFSGIDANLAGTVVFYPNGGTPLDLVDTSFYPRFYVLVEGSIHDDTVALTIEILNKSNSRSIYKKDSSFKLENTDSVDSESAGNPSFGTISSTIFFSSTAVANP